MTDTNVVVIKGNLTRDLESDERNFGYTSNGTARANITVACNRSRKQGDEWVNDVSYFDVTIWGKTAENLKPYLKKGKCVVVQGYLKQDRWEKDGQKQSKVSIVAENVQLLGGKDDKDKANNNTSSTNQVNAEENNMYGNQGFAEDIPF